ncbi:protein YhfH [Peribacillus butanolivorans]
MQTNQSSLLINHSFNHCPECGETLVEQSDSYLMECDRCLSKREE